MISDDEVEKIIEHMEYLYGKLPSPIHEPKRSLFYLKMYNYYLKRKGKV